ncbi:hypothetical protein [Streptomyces sp. TS71-3]|uniref:hypothetical protein n=1 Tax=Streptomyces sp. TS71-3 TaxID=2733862 RepID=UPI001B27E9B1|nr:hypothetical protein [Streptomyces sp. TS71-3]GHJ40955.1 hypothetical protein Sm713_65640 [Streptomyces sp. TS71-3]
MAAGSGFPSAPPARRGVLAAGATAGLALLTGGCRSAVLDAVPDPRTPPRHGGTLTVAASSDAQPSAVFATRDGNTAWRRLVFDTLTELDDDRTPARCSPGRGSSPGTAPGSRCGSATTSASTRDAR